MKRQTEDYVPPTVTVDFVIFKVIDERLNVLLIQRKKNPFKGAYALPGGYSPQGKTTLETVSEVTNKKAGVDVSTLEHAEQLYTFDSVARDPRGHAVAIAYMGLGRDIAIDGAVETAENPRFLPIDSLPELAYDHKEIIQMAHARLKSKISYSSIVFALLPLEFTFSELQTAYEAIFEKPLDKRNFRKKFASFDLIKDTGRMQKEGAHRPAKLYEFNNRSFEEFDRTFD